MIIAYLFKMFNIINNTFITKNPPMKTNNKEKKKLFKAKTLLKTLNRFLSRPKV